MPILQMAFSCDRREVSLLLFAEHLKLLFRGRRVRFFDVRRDTPGLRSGGQRCGLKTKQRRSVDRRCCLKDAVFSSSRLRSTM